MVSGSLGSVGGESGVPLITFTLNYDVGLDIRVHLSFQDLPGPISNRCIKALDEGCSALLLGFWFRRVNRHLSGSKHALALAALFDFPSQNPRRDAKLAGIVERSLCPRC